MNFTLESNFFKPIQSLDFNRRYLPNLALSPCLDPVSLLISLSHELQSFTDTL